MSKFKMTSGKVAEPYLVIIYGPNGVGKSSIAAEFPKSGFIDIEEGTKNLDVERMPRPENYVDFHEQLDELATNKSFKSIVVDTADHLESLMVKKICSDADVEALTDIPHGKGFEMVKLAWEDLFIKLKKIKKEKNIVILAHADIVPFTDPLHAAGAYDRYNIRLSKKGLQSVKSNVDAILFMNYTTTVFKKKGEAKGRGDGGEDRALYTQYRASHEGKNRFGLPYQIDLPTSGMFKAFDDAVKAGDPQSPEVICSEIEGLLTKLTEGELKTKATAQFDAANKANDLAKLVAIKNRLLEVTQE